MTSQAMQAQTQEYSLTVAEAAALLGSDERAIQRLIFTARVDAVRLKAKKGHEYRLRADEILARREELRERIGAFDPEALRPVGRDLPAEMLEALARGAEVSHPERAAPEVSPAVTGAEPETLATAPVEAALIDEAEAVWEPAAESAIDVEEDVTAGGAFGQEAFTAATDPEAVTAADAIDAVVTAPVDAAFAEALDQTLAEVLAALPDGETEEAEGGWWDAAVEVIAPEESQTVETESTDREEISADDFPSIEPAAATEEFESGDRFFPRWAPIPVPSGTFPVWTPTLSPGAVTAGDAGDTGVSVAAGTGGVEDGAALGQAFPLDAPPAMSDHGVATAELTAAQTWEEDGQEEPVTAAPHDEAQPALPVSAAENDAVDAEEDADTPLHRVEAMNGNAARVEATEEALRILAGDVTTQLPDPSDAGEPGGRHTFIDYSRLSARLAAANEKTRQAREAAKKPKRANKGSLTSTLSSLLKRKK